jgi:hypothetical protein
VHADVVAFQRAYEIALAAPLAVIAATGRFTRGAPDDRRATVTGARAEGRSAPWRMR